MHSRLTISAIFLALTCFLSVIGAETQTDNLLLDRPSSAVSTRTPQIQSAEKRWAARSDNAKYKPGYRGYYKRASIGQKMEVKRDVGDKDVFETLSHALMNDKRSEEAIEVSGFDGEPSPAAQLNVRSMPPRKTSKPVGRPTDESKMGRGFAWKRA
ncbi:hypothetical protein BY996DRAFT_6425764 [Phakopsora pachyrhizi]|uniref:Expressed protein n=1 Tax=Phakopsora pachyrhizi TaxID=170000 RepID=A0AAV0B466_PHAPC|nr:hypothetical protein BY996DRAFT_6425764 [Phakopsora pachyrhizi]CAH7681366.1 expressed protein [Phakopsora pachyrhizi]